MKTERIIEILQLVIYNLENNTKLFDTGICVVTTTLFKRGEMSESEYLFIRNLIRDSKPTTQNVYKEFTQNGHWNDSLSSTSVSFWWIPIYRNPKTREIRIDYLNKVIENISK